MGCLHDARVARRGHRAGRARPARGVSRVPPARHHRAHGGGDRRGQRRALRARRRLGLERARVPGVRAAVRSPRVALPRGLRDHPRPARGRARDASTGPTGRPRRPSCCRPRPAPSRSCSARAARGSWRRRCRTPRAGTPGGTPTATRPRASRRTNAGITAIAQGAGRRPRIRRAQRLRDGLVRSHGPRAPAPRRAARHGQRRARSPGTCTTSPRPAPTRRSSCSIRSTSRASARAAPCSPRSTPERAVRWTGG